MMRLTLGQLRMRIAEALGAAGGHAFDTNPGMDRPELGNDEYVRADDAAGTYDTTIHRDPDPLSALMPAGKSAWKLNGKRER